MKKCLFLSIFILIIFVSDCLSQCNGYGYLCNRRYNDVSYLTTHNAFNNSADGFFMPNQNNSITQQLNDGVRGFMIDVYDYNGVITVYHGFPYLGTKPFSYTLGEFKAFMDSNPNEIITLIIESYVTANQIETALTDAGLFNYVFKKDSTQPWPTLQEMIDAGKRLVIFSEKDNASPTQLWHHYIWDYAFETDYSISDTIQFTFDYNRGDSSNQLFILNHFVTNDLIGTGSAAQAAIANANPFLANRVNMFLNYKNRFPNFVALDFYEIGDGMDVVNTLNSLNWAGVEQSLIAENELNIWPVPSNGIINIRTPDKKEYEDANLIISNVVGQKVYSGNLKNGYAQICLPDNLLNGVYFITIYGRDEKIIISGKFLTSN